MYWEISKEFDFCYGHRVWSQVLEQEFALKTCFACRHLHGHQGKIIVHLQSKVLNDGMVTDFGHLNWFKSFLNDTLDNKFIIDINDPLFNPLLPHLINKENLISHESGYKTPDFKIIKDEPAHIIEMYEGYVIVNFIPTSENISTWLIEIIQKKMDKINIKVSHVEFLETPKSKSVVYAKS
ncbi:MAG: 6-carboxytetrahydropterin synthase [Campylobacteraceae bacterium]|nr:6-carboxytetrahydropterin synthase [Campylobacteraceae bacterium]